MGNWLLIAVGMIFLIGIVTGIVKGFFRIGLSILSTVLTIVLMIFLNPYVAEALTKYTPVDDMIKEKCMELFMPRLSDEQLLKIDFSGTPLAELSREQLADLGSLDWESMGIDEKDVLKVLGEIPRDDQIKQIEGSALPTFMKNTILENNNSEIYKTLGVTSFTEYVSSYIAQMAIKLLSFLITFLLAIIIVKALMAAVDIIGELPVLGTLNRIAGGILGIVGALLFVWLVFLVITVMYSTALGKSCFDMIESSQILTYLYNKNILLQKLLRF